jgi:hypothetical protein
MRVIEEDIAKAIENEKNVTRINDLLIKKADLMAVIGELWLRNHLLTLLPARGGTNDSITYGNGNNNTDNINIRDYVMLWSQDMRQNRVKMWVPRNMKGVSTSFGESETETNAIQNDTSDNVDSGAEIDNHDKKHAKSKKNGKKNQKGGGGNNPTEIPSAVEGIEPDLPEMVPDGPEGGDVASSNRGVVIPESTPVGGDLIDFSFEDVGGAGGGDTSTEIQDGGKIEFSLVGDEVQDGGNSELIDFDFQDGGHNDGEIIREFTLE